MDTPRLIVDRVILDANIARVQAIADGLGLALRPHVKTHKSLDVARLQLAAGARGLTASKVGEALVFVRGLGRILADVTCAYPIVAHDRLVRLLETAAMHGVAVRLMADSDETVDAAAGAAEAVGSAPALLVKIDVGLHRCGLAPVRHGEDNPALAALARRAMERGLPVMGVLSHAGQAYGAADAAGVLAIAREECAIMARAKRILEDAGVEVRVVSVGTTPTVLALGMADDAQEWASVLTELRPGNYVFLDRAALRLGLADVADVALTVAATVVGDNHGHVICDAGSKTLSSDGGAHGSVQPGFGLAWPEERFPEPDVETMMVDRLSEEHGWLLPPMDRDGHRGPRPAVGQGLRIVPNHACAAANLADAYTVPQPDGSLAEWPVHARGKVR